ncbi:hypothetical protein E2C01_071428 [Portunus trituberculatus]|uniref:Uncharacterized protein n=1 Tax=Portunus trituberculatus TaxID=210409 RepID=A0A5B7HVC1_PORTR|nr:hypothetical protein [Portunus trituberculatus]
MHSCGYYFLVLRCEKAQHARSVWEELASLCCVFEFLFLFSNIRVSLSSELCGASQTTDVPSASAKGSRPPSFQPRRALPVSVVEGVVPVVPRGLQPPQGPRGSGGDQYEALAPSRSPAECLAHLGLTHLGQTHLGSGWLRPHLHYLYRTLSH